MRAAFSALFWAYLALGCVPLFLGAVVIWLATLPFDRNGRILHLYSCFWAQLFFWSNPFWRLRVEGRQHLPWRGGAVLVSNHASLADILVLFGLWRPFKWVSKESNFRIPFIGWNMLLNRYVPLVRGDKESIAAMVRACEAWLSRGVPVLLFPEGTRSSDGQVKAVQGRGLPDGHRAAGATHPHHPQRNGRCPPQAWLGPPGTARCRIRVLPPVDPGTFRG
jgi:1-acyl-sn-glycerol-3-phosphate acyltransferase